MSNTHSQQEVSDTPEGVSYIQEGVSDTRPGVSITLVGVFIKCVDVSEYYPEGVRGVTRGPEGLQLL